MKKTSISLADGRELMYFDERDDVSRDDADLRPLTPTQTSSEIRYDELLDRWVIVASHRQDRTYHPASDSCPLCPSTAGRLTEIPAPTFDVVVFENRFPALTAAGGEAVAAVHSDGGDVLVRPGAGRCEVICFTAAHGASFSTLDHPRVDLVMAAWIDRTIELSQVPGVEQVFCFENRGHDIGVTLDHPHGQVYAYPFVTPRTAAMLTSSAAYYRRTKRNLFDDVVQREKDDKTRVVATNSAWTAFVPRAARWPYEVHLYPNRRVPDVAALDDRQRAGFADIYLDLLGRFDRLFDEPAPYISAWHQAPVREGRDRFALHLELFTTRRTPDKLKYLAGSESAMDAFTNDVAPEAAAERLRELG